MHLLRFSSASCFDHDFLTGPRSALPPKRRDILDEATRRLRFLEIRNIAPGSAASVVAPTPA